MDEIFDPVRLCVADLTKLHCKMNDSKEVKGVGAEQSKRATIYDVIIIGAGLSGIGTAYWLQQKSSHKRFVILEARSSIGGTWDLFRYPGVRSDSDMFTFGYRFKPWKNPQPLSDGASIMTYLRETVEENSIDKKILFEYKVTGANWSSGDACWTVNVNTPSGSMELKTRFLCMCSGYYSYEKAHRPTFPGEENYRGKIVLPQFWPNDLDYTGKQVVIVGSGATAITLLPAMAGTAGHVTMLQRSPTYIMSLPTKDKFHQKVHKWFPPKLAYRLTRWKNLLLSMAFYKLSRLFPGYTRGLIRKGAISQLPLGYDVEAHSTQATVRGTNVCVLYRTVIFTKPSGREKPRSRQMKFPLLQKRACC